MMEGAQREAYCGALAEYHPYFWASKMHFNLTDIPFYNFPYTFGYLFSTAVYHHANVSKNFEKTYIDLLSDTGRMSSEDLAKKHLKADLTEKAFWQNVLDILKRDAEEFLN
jgi:oligoendopeptidase F